MKLQAVKTFVTSKAGRQVLKLRKGSPTIMFGAGVVGVIAATVLACRATLKLDDILAETDEQLEKVRTMEDARYSEQDRQRDLVLVRVKGGLKIFRAYAPSIAVGSLAIAALTGSHVTLRRRNVAMAAAYATVDKAFREYRARVTKELGADKDNEFMYDLREHEVIVVDPKASTSVAVTKKLIGPDGASGYAVCFDESNLNWNRKPHYNQMFIQCQQNFANDLLHARGHVFLNEVYRMLGLPHTKAGAVVGWIKGNGDNYIDFGIFANDEYSGILFADGSEPSIWLDFNVDGVIYDKI